MAAEAASSGTSGLGGGNSQGAMQATGAIGGLLLGGYAGSQKRKAYVNQFQVLSPQTQAEADAFAIRNQALDDLRVFLGSHGPGEQQIQEGFQQQRHLADVLQSQINTSGLPLQQDITAANQFAQNIFAPQLQAHEVDMGRYRENVNQLAAQLGRPTNDPVMLEKIMRMDREGRGQINAQMTSAATQFAQALPQQRLQLENALAQLRGGLASQAIQNRMKLKALGSAAGDADRQFRMQTAATRQEDISGGGSRGMALGALSGFTAGAKAFS